MTDVAATVAARLREYSDAFVESVHRKDPTLMRPYCHLPAMVLGRGRTITIETSDANDARWRRAAEAVPDDYAKSVLHTVDVTLVDDTVAWVTADCGRFNEAGLEYHRFLASYLMVEIDGEWKITTWVAHGSGAPSTTRH